MSLTKLSLDGLVNRASMNLLGAGELFTTGNVFYVDSNNGSDGATGTDPASPKATIDSAVGSCTANNGDIIVVMPNHVETVIAAAGLDLDVAGITVIGLGSGSNMPQVNFTTAVGADMDVDAADITVVNLDFTGGFDALTGPIDVNAANFKMIGCKTRDVTGQATDFIVTDANADGLYISGWRHEGAAAAGADTAISIVGGDNIVVENFWIDGNFAVSAIENVTTAAVNLTIGGSSTPWYIRTRNAADIAITLVATTTGVVLGAGMIRLQDDAANITEAIVLGDCNSSDNIWVANADTEKGMLWNGTASTDA